MTPRSCVRDLAEPNSSVCAALFVAETVCQARGVRLTPIRKSALRTLWEAGQPLGAYDILEHMAINLDRRLAPPTVYRALDFLLEQKFISKIESRNAFVPCTHTNPADACVFFICENCGSAAEIEDDGLDRLLARQAQTLGFRVSKRVLEFQGTCAGCIAAQPPPPPPSEDRPQCTHQAPTYKSRRQRAIRKFDTD
jgi:Fur family transcriptional regulator, zinc uptake regulator